MDALRHFHRPAVYVLVIASGSTPFIPRERHSDHVLRCPVSDIYHVSFPRERFAIWVSVYIIFALDIFQSIVVANEAWETLCSGWGRPINLQFPGWTFTALPIVSSISA